MTPETFCIYLRNVIRHGDIKLEENIEWMLGRVEIPMDCNWFFKEDVVPKDRKDIN